jgi:regulatory protein
MQITKLSHQANNQNRVNIFVDGNYLLSLTLDQILEQKIKVGSELGQADIDKLNQLSTEGKIKARALEWLLSRPRSRQEFKDYLYKKKLDKDKIVQFCDFFENKGYQSDEQFAKWWVDQRVRKNKSNLSIKTELKQKGISEDVIANVLQLQVSSRDRLKELIVSKKLINKYPDKPKLIRYLASKGFEYSDIVDALGELNDGTFSL